MNPLCDRLTLTDYIAKPLQRLTKYPLLLKRILNNTPPKHTQEVGHGFRVPWGCGVFASSLGCKANNPPSLLS